MLEDSNRHLEVEIEALREENAMLRRMLFGRKSEKLIHEKIGLDEPEEQEKEAAELPATEQATPRRSTQPKRKRRLSATVTKEIEHLVVPEEVLQNPLAYTRLPESSNRISRRLEYVPGHFDLHIYRMPSFVTNGKRSKSGQDAPIYASAPQGILPGSNMGASIIALALHNKYSLHLPLYRQIKELERIGLQGVSEGVLCNWVRAAADALEPVWKALHELMLDAAPLHIDDSPFAASNQTRAMAICGP